MRILLLSLQEVQESAPGSGSTQARRIRLEEDQSLAMVEAMRDGGNLAPMLVCLQNSRLHRLAAERNLPLLAVSGGRSLWGMVRLWRWQRRHRSLLVQTVGEEAMRLGYWVFRMRRPGTTLLAHAFFLRPPAETACCSREMLSASRILYGSSYVRERLRQAWEGAVCQEEYARLNAALIALQPGIDSEGFAPSISFEEGGRFVFAMNDSLVPRSGAQTVVRAMAALWQRSDLPAWEVRMLGAGPRFQEVLSEARSLGVASRLCLLHEQSVPQVLSFCHAWLAPGSAPDEAPKTLWQGFAAGLPVICSRSSLHLERLAPHASSVWPEGPASLVPVNDAQALARAMIDCMQQADLREELIRRSHFVFSQTGWRHMAAQACMLFEDWLQGLETATPGQQCPASSESPLPLTDSHEM